MTDFYKQIENGYIVGIGTNGPDNMPAVTEEEYGELLSVIRDAPTAPDGYTYMLTADTLTWELVELPPAPPEPEELTADEALDILLGGEVE